MKKRCLLILLIIVLGITMLKAQEKYSVRGKVFVKEGKPTKVSLSITYNQKSIRIPVDVDGNFATSLEWNQNYQFYFSKPGYVGKKINFSTIIPGDIERKYIYPYEILVELFPNFPNADTTFFKNPVAKIAYSIEVRDFEYDLDYLLIVKEKTNELIKQYEAYRQQAVQKKVTTNSSTTKSQELTAIDYQKNVEIKSTQTGTPNVVTKVSHTLEPSALNNKDQFGLPPLQDSYPEGKTIEVYPLTGKIITRVIIKNGVFHKTFYKVEHNWGGLYYFVEESPDHYRSISKYNFEKATQI